MADKDVEMTVETLLNILDGWGIVYTDKDLVIERLAYFGYAIFDKITIEKPSEQ